MKAEFQPKKQENGTLKDEGAGLQESSKEDCGASLRPEIPAMSSRNSCPIDEVQSVRDSCGSSVCVLAVSSFVLAVTDVLVPSSMVSVRGEVDLSSSDCESVESKSFSLSLWKASSVLF